MRIKEFEVIDIRVPTSDSLLGSDPFHRKPNYSVVLTKLFGGNGLEGISVNFTIGAGTDWVAYAVRDLMQLIVGRSLDEFTEDPGGFHRMLLDHHQLRWLGDGMGRMVIGSVMNSLWDLWAKEEGKPLWKLLVDLPPKTIIDCIDWRYLKDALDPAEALEILEKGLASKAEREQHMSQKGPKAYSTAGWLGLSDNEIVKTIEEVKKQGLNCFKMKVGLDVQKDKERLAFIRNSIGEDSLLMLDANQIWGVEEAISHMLQLVEFRPFWIEEPTARDDVLGYQRIGAALKPYGVGLACGEQVPSPVIFKQLLQQGLIQFCQIDATRLSGVNDVMAVILMAAKYRVPVCPHGGGIGLCNMIQHYAIWDQIAVSAKSDTQVVEYLNFLQDEVFLHPVTMENGAYILPQVPGWGLEMTESFVERHAYPTGKVWQGREASGGVTFLA